MRSTLSAGTDGSGSRGGLAKGPFGHEPDGDGVVVFADGAATATDCLFHVADFEAGGGGEFLADADEGPVLVEVIAIDVAAEVEEDFVPECDVGFAGIGQRNGGAEHVADAVFVAPVGEVVVVAAGGFGHFTDPTLLEAEALGPVEADELEGMLDLLPSAVFGELGECGVVAIGIGADVGPAGADGDGGADLVIDAGADKELLPFVTEIGAAILDFEMEPPGAVAKGVVADIVEPEVAVGVGYFVLGMGGGWRKKSDGEKQQQ